MDIHLHTPASRIFNSLKSVTWKSYSALKPAGLDIIALPTTIRWPVTAKCKKKSNN